MKEPGLVTRNCRMLTRFVEFENIPASLRQSECGESNDSQDSNSLGQLGRWHWVESSSLITYRNSRK